MARNLFVTLKKYAGTTIPQDENYATEAFATLIDEFAAYRDSLFRNLFNVRLEGHTTVETQVPYETNCYGRAYLDLAVEDRHSYLIIEVKVEGGLNYYENGAQTGEHEYTDVAIDQIVKYGDCKGLPDKEVKIFTLSKYPISLDEIPRKYFHLESGRLLWRQVYAETNKYCRSIKEDSTERYLLQRFTEFLKEEGMAGFQGFHIHHIADLSQRAETDGICADLTSLVLESDLLPGFEGKPQRAYGRSGALFEPDEEGTGYVGIFVGLWLTDEKDYFINFKRETGPQAMVFVETDPRGSTRKRLLSSKAFRTVSNRFVHETHGWQILLCHKPLLEFLSSDNQGDALLRFYREAIDDLRTSGFLEEITSPS